ERAGDVIPAVVERTKESGRSRSEPFTMPRQCPVCGSGVYRDGAHHYCSGGLACFAQLEGSIHHYASRPAMNIEHLGNKTVQALVEKKYKKIMSLLEKRPGSGKKKRHVLSGSWWIITRWIIA
ncbi:MAG TPA: hypothetical protein VJ879_14490, partial [Desulfobacter sp.]|nr:hypothetical protein [Desulfobacter sp.]